MLLLDILLKKKTVVDKYNNNILDLTASSVNNTFIKGTRIIKVVLVSSEFKMRPDLVAQAALGSSNYMDVLLKFNGISNPYSLYTGQLLYIPNIDDVATHMIDNSVVSTPLREIVFNPDKLSVSDKARLKFLEDRASTLNNTGSVLPPNFDPNGNQEVTVKDGKIVFGDNVSLPIDRCTLLPLSKAQFKEKILANQINGNLS